SGTDPSGYGFFSDLFSPITDAWHGIWDSTVGRIAVTVAVAYFTGYYDGGIFGAGNAIANGAAAGFAGGFVGSGGNFQAGIYGGITGGAFGWVGGLPLDPWQAVAAHAGVGCATSSISGGDCGSGALAAGFGKFATQNMPSVFKGSTGYELAYVTVVGGTASVLGGGKFENGATTAAFGYLFNYLSHSRAAGPYVEQLRAGSAQAREMLDAMAADPNTNYYIDVGPVPESAGGGTTRIQQPSLSLWDRLLGRSAPAATVIMTVDVSSQVQFTDVGGQSFSPSALRILGHELGHGYTYLLGGYMGYRTNYDAAIRYENQISRQLSPNAPLRAISDHGRGP
ncbi:MAG: hypothetical protein PHX38_11175, partial [Sulfuricella sp.]|nr:hypothetical protein [Sulfuricella sp.]